MGVYYRGVPQVYCSGNDEKKNRLMHFAIPLQYERAVLIQNLISAHTKDF